MARPHVSSSKGGVSFAHMDPINGYHPSEVIQSNLGTYLSIEWQERKAATKCRYEAKRIETLGVKVPQQPNNYDCGVYFILFMKSILEMMSTQLDSLSNNPAKALSSFFTAAMYEKKVADKERESILIRFDEEEALYLKSKKSILPGSPSNDPVFLHCTVEKRKEFLSYIKSLYSQMDSNSMGLGGDSCDGISTPIYGELNPASMTRITEKMQEHCDLNSSSIFMDIGSGRGKPCFHVFIQVKPVACVGIELVENRHLLSVNNLVRCFETISDKSIFEKKRVIFLKKDGAKMRSFYPCTHIYLFDVGFPPAAMEGIAVAFNRTHSAEYLISYHTPRNIQAYGFEVEYLNISVTGLALTGSNEKKTAYLFKSVQKPSIPHDQLLEDKDEDLSELYESLVPCNENTYFLDANTYFCNAHKAMMKYAGGKNETRSSRRARINKDK